MSGQKVCDELLKKSWQNYNLSSVPEKPGIYAIGQKVRSEETKYLYVGRSNDIKRRLQEHKNPTPQQDIDKRVAGKFKHHKESELKIKYVPEKRQKTVEGPCIERLTKKKGYSPVLNKRAGDSSKSSAGSQIKSKPQRSGPKSSGGASSIRSFSGPKVRSSGGASSVRSFSGPNVRSSGGASVRSLSRSIARPVTGRASFRSVGRRK